jgi:hypothetical protein
MAFHLAVSLHRHSSMSDWSAAWVRVRVRVRVGVR